MGMLLSCGEVGAWMFDLIDNKSQVTERDPNLDTQ